MKGAGLQPRTLPEPLSFALSRTMELLCCKSDTIGNIARNNHDFKTRKEP